MTETKKRNLFYAVGLASLILAIFGRSLFFPFLTWDDNELLTSHPLFQRITWDNICSYWDPQLLRSGVLLDYSPIRDMSYALDRFVFGWNAVGFHVVQLLLHVVNAWFIFKIMSRKMLSYRAWVIAFLWAVHPLCVEPVVWISSRKDLLFLFFFLWSWDAYENRKAGIALFSGACSLLSKYTAVVLGPFLFFKDLRFTQKKMLFVPALLTISAFFLGAFVMWANQKQEKLVSISDAASVFDAWPAGFQIVTHFFHKSFAPIFLSARYVQHPEWSWLRPEVLIGILLFFALLVGAIKKESLLLLLFGLVPSMIQVTVGHPIWMADRYAYLPLIGLVWFVVEVVFTLSERFHKIIVVLMLCFSILSSARVRVWKDPLSLWGDTVEKSPTFYLNQGNLGIAHIDSGDANAAIPFLQKALELNPSWTKGYLYLSDAHLQLGQKRLSEMMLDKIQSNSNLSTNDKVYQAILFGRMGNQTKARIAFETLLIEHGDDPYVLSNAGIFYVMNNEKEKAFGLWQKAVGIFPNYPSARVNLAVFYFLSKDCEKTLEQLSLAQNPSAEDRKKISWLFKQCKQ